MYLIARQDFGRTLFTIVEKHRVFRFGIGDHMLIGHNMSFSRYNKSGAGRHLSLFRAFLSKLRNLKSGTSVPEKSLKKWIASKRINKKSFNNRDILGRNHADHRRRDQFHHIYHQFILAQNDFLYFFGFGNPFYDPFQNSGLIEYKRTAALLSHSKQRTKNPQSQNRADDRHDKTQHNSKYRNLPGGGLIFIQGL